MAKKLEQLLTSFLPGQGACRTISGPRCAHKKNLVYLRRSKEVVQKLQNRSREHSEMGFVYRSRN